MGEKSAPTPEPTSVPARKLPHAANTNVPVRTVRTPNGMIVPVRTVPTEAAASSRRMTISAKDVPYVKIANAIRSIQTYPERDEEGWVMIESICELLSLRHSPVISLCRERTDLFVVNIDSAPNRIQLIKKWKVKIQLTVSGEAFGLAPDAEASFDKNHTLTGEQLQKVEPQLASTSAPSAKWKESHFKAKWSGTKVAEIAKFIQVNRDANGTMDTQSIQ